MKHYIKWLYIKATLGLVWFFFNKLKQYIQVEVLLEVLDTKNFQQLFLRI